MTEPVAILAGGMATRLGPAARHVPKILIDVAGRPFAEHQLDRLQREGIERVVYCVGHLAAQVRAALGDGSRWGMTFAYVEDGPELLGTGGAIRRALPDLGDRFFVMYGDSYLTCSMRDVARAFDRSGQPALMTVFQNDNRWDGSNVRYRDGRIERYDKAQPTPDMRHIDYGLGMLTAGVFEPYREGARLDLADVYGALARAGTLAGYEVPERFYEIGSHEGLAETRAFLAARKDPS
ncbi:MAG: nucleotidyltransferase family protein [Acidobacteriota bacterium]|nr:nucleotidyltransferase family protein [Acidobacteriota bacterium]